MSKRRLQLYGKKATSHDIENEISRLLFANGDRPYPLNPSEIANALGLSRGTVYNYIKKLSKKGNVIRLKSGHFLLPKCVV